MKNLLVTAEMSAEVTFNVGSVALDALLAGQVARRDGLPGHRRGEPTDVVPEPPLARHERGFYLASWVLPADVVWSHATHIHKPCPVDWYLRLCTDDVRRIDIGAGADKAYRVPRHRSRYRELTWVCVGDAEAVDVLLRGVTRVGSYRRDGIGKVRCWRVEECEAWDGFPILRDGIPLRSLPRDMPGLAADVRTGMASLRFPYWEPTYQEMLAIP